MTSQQGILLAGWLGTDSLVRGSFFELVHLASVPAALLELLEDVTDCISEFTGAGVGAEAGKAAFPEDGKGLADSNFSALQAICLSPQPSLEVSDPLLALASLAASSKASCALAAATLAAAAHSMLRRHPEEWRDRTVQQGCCLALGLSSAAYTWFALAPGMMLLQINRPDLVLLSLCNGVVVSIFTLNLGLLAEQGPEKAAPPLLWSLLSTASSVAAAAAPGAGTLGQVLMLGFGLRSAELAARKALCLANAAVSPENRRWSRYVCDILRISLLLHPLVNGLALWCPNAGLLALAASDAIFQTGAAHTILRSRWAVARAIDVKVARSLQTI